MIFTNPMGALNANAANLKNRQKIFNGSNANKEESFFSSITFITIAAYVTWLWLGVLWYMYYHGWNFGTAYYYALEAGLSIGFCNPAEKDDTTKLFTTFYVMVGSSLIAGSVGALTANIFYSRIRISPIEYKSGYLSIKDLEQDKITFSSFKNYCWFELKLAVGWYHNRRRTCSFIVFVLFMGLGVFYGMNNENFTFITALYWAITSATGGLESTPCLNDIGTLYHECDMGNLRGVIMGTFFMFGVPIYAYTMSHVSSLLIERVMVEQDRKNLRQPVDEADFKYASNVLHVHYKGSKRSDDQDDRLNMGEFLLFQLMRLGLTSSSQLESLKEDFYALDKERLGYVDIDTFRKNLVGPEKATKLIYRKQRAVEKLVDRLTTRKIKGSHRNNNVKNINVADKKNSNYITDINGEWHEEEEEDADHIKATSEGLDDNMNKLLNSAGDVESEFDQYGQ